MKQHPEVQESATFSSRWQKDFQESLKTTQEVKEFLKLEYPLAETPYPLFIPRPFASKIKKAGIDSPLGRQFLPSFEENAPQGLEDPIADDIHSKGNGIIHRYKNRILFTPTEVCPIQCRYCFRKNELHKGMETFKAHLNKAVIYLKEHSEVEEVILTGGDPLILSDEKLEVLFSAFSQVSSIKMIRLHSRTPVILPNRITPTLLALFRSFEERFHAITLVIHTNHLSEFTPEFLFALSLLRKTKVQLLSQSVLLRGVNDDWEDLRALFMGLYRNGVRPYYLHHPDPVKGGMHFMVSREEGAKVYRELKSNISGVLLPHYVIETENGGGKTFALTLN